VLLLDPVISGVARAQPLGKEVQSA